MSNSRPDISADHPGGIFNFLKQFLFSCPDHLTVTLKNVFLQTLTNANGDKSNGYYNSIKYG